MEWITYGERRVVIISDSAMAGVRWYGATDALVGADYELYLESCRRLVRRSCQGREGYVPYSALRQIERLDEARNHRDVLVIATGYNDWEGRFASTGRGSDDLGALMSAAREKSFKNVVWVTLRSDSRYRLPKDSPLWYADYGAMNEAVRSESSDLFPGSLSGISTFTPTLQVPKNFSTAMECMSGGLDLGSSLIGSHATWPVWMGDHARNHGLLD